MKQRDLVGTVNRGMEDCHEQPKVFGPFVKGQYSKIKKKKKKEFYILDQMRINWAP